MKYLRSKKVEEYFDETVKYMLFDDSVHRGCRWIDNETREFVSKCMYSIMCSMVSICCGGNFEIYHMIF